MSGFARVGLLAGVFLGLGVAGPTGATAQWQGPDDRGWIGISFEAVIDSRGRSTGVIVTSVSDGSPADEAGLRPGDRVLSINDLDRPSQLARLNELLRLHVGDAVRMEVERDGAHRHYRLRAAPRPVEFTPRQEYEISVRSEDIVQGWVRSMDSLRVRVIEGGSETIRVRGSDSRGARIEVRARADVERGRTLGGTPFEFFVFSGEEHDSLRQEMLHLDEESSEVRARLARMENLLRRSADRDVRRERDHEIQSLQSQLEELSTRSTQLRAAMAEVAWRNAGESYRATERVSSQAPGVGSSVVRRAGGGSDEFRPLTPYLLGRNRVAGAEVADLRSELAAYFEVDGGVLVLDVAPRTPADISGIRPGDVIIRIDQVRIRTVEELRFGVSVADDTLPITLIRKGSSVQVLLRR